MKANVKTGMYAEAGGRDGATSTVAAAVTVDAEGVVCEILGVGVKRMIVHTMLQHHVPYWVLVYAIDQQTSGGQACGTQNKEH